MIYLLFIVSLLASISAVVLNYFTSCRVAEIAEVLEEFLGEMPDEHKKEEEIFPDSQELPEHVMERENAFNERISQIKDELAMQYAKEREPHSVATELHPYVKNLPHTEIYKSTIGEEYAE